MKGKFCERLTIKSTKHVNGLIHTLHYYCISVIINNFTLDLGKNLNKRKRLLNIFLVF